MRCRDFCFRFCVFAFSVESFVAISVLSDETSRADDDGGDDDDCDSRAIFHRNHNNFISFIDDSFE